MTQSKTVRPSHKKKFSKAKKGRQEPETNITDSEIQDTDQDSDAEPQDETEELETLQTAQSVLTETTQSTLPALASETEHLPALPASNSKAAISPTDPLRRYLDEIRRYPLLDPEEEFRLATRLREQGDLEAAKILVSSNLRLVVKIAMEYRSVYTNLLDLIQEGNIGLMKAVSKYDPTHGARLGYYSSWWIRSYILKYLLDNFRLVRIGTTQAQKKLFFHLLREKERLEAQGIGAAPKLLAEKLDVREKDVIEMEQRLSGRGAEVSLDAPMDPETGRSTYLDQMPDEREAADDALARHELLKLLQGKIPDFQKLLNAKELRIFKDRLLAEQPHTLQEIANLYGLTRERARQIEAKVIQKLREFLRPYL